MNARLLPTLVGLLCAVLCTRIYVLPLRELTLVKLELPVDTAARLVALTLLAQTLRPVIALVIDRSARHGIGRLCWLRGAAVLAIAAGLASVSQDSSVARVLAMFALTAGCVVVVEVVASAVIVSEQARGGQSAALGAARTFVLTTAALVAGLAAGWTAEAPLQRLGPLVAGLMTVVLLSTWLTRRPEPEVAPPMTRTRLPGTALAVALLAGVFYGVPGFETVLVDRQRGELGLSTMTIGMLGSLNNGAALVGILLYHRLRGRIALPVMLPAAIAMYALSSVPYLFYGPGLIIPTAEVLNGLVGTFGLAAISETAVRGAGRDGRALAIAVILGAANVGILLAEILGAALSAAGLSFAALVSLHVACHGLLAWGVWRLRARLAC